MAQPNTQIDTSQVKWDEKPDPSQVKWDSAPASQPSATVTPDSPISDLGNEALRVGVKGATAIPGMLADALTAAVNMIPDKYAKQNLQMPTEALDQAMDKVTKPPDSKMGRVAEDVVSGIMVPQTEAEKAAVAAGKILATPAKQKAIELAHTHGFTLPPSETGATVGKAIQSVSGKAAVERDASLANLDAAERLAKTDLGLRPDSMLDEATFAALRAHEDSAYQAVADTGTIKASEKYLNAVVSAGQKFTEAEKDFPGSIHPDVDRIKSIAMQPQFSARAAIDKMKLLRDDANAHLRSGKAEDRAVGMVERELSQALKDEIQRHLDELGKPELAEQFKNAQRNLAKINTVQDAMLGSRMSARALATAKAQGAPLDGNLKIIADSATEFPKAFQDVQKGGEWGPWSVWDLTWALSSLAGGLEHHPALFAGIAARPVARAALKSKAYQGAMVDGAPKAFKPGVSQAAGTAGLIDTDLSSDDTTLH